MLASTEIIPYSGDLKGITCHKISKVVEFNRLKMTDVAIANERISYILRLISMA